MAAMETTYYSLIGFEVCLLNTYVYTYKQILLSALNLSVVNGGEIYAPPKMLRIRDG